MYPEMGCGLYVGHGVLMHIFYNMDLKIATVSPRDLSEILYTTFFIQNYPLSKLRVCQPIFCSQNFDPAIFTF